VCTDHTVLPANYTVPASVPLPRKRSPDGASPDWGCGHLIAAYYSFIYPRKNERLSRPGWLIYSGRIIHISGHPSAAGQAQDRESSPVKDQRSTTVPHNQRVQTVNLYIYRKYSSNETVKIDSVRVNARTLFGLSTSVQPLYHWRVRGAITRITIHQPKLSLTKKILLHAPKFDI